jgi:Arc/MetJ family transcription regulator
MGWGGKNKMKRTNVVLDEKIVAQAKKATGIKITRQLVDHALRELVRRRRQKEILRLRGSVQWEGDLTSWRRGRFPQ